MKSISDIVKFAQQYVKATLPPLTQQSPPIAIGTGEELRGVLMYFRGEIVDPDLRYQIWPPSYVATFRMQDGKFQELLAVSPESFQLDSDPSLPLGAGFAPQDKLQPNYLAQLARYYQSLDQLLPRFASGKPLSPELLPVATDAQEALAKILEAPLHIYLQRVGSDFFNWLNAEHKHAILSAGS